jgi:hypothetical protein
VTVNGALAMSRLTGRGAKENRARLAGTPSALARADLFANRAAFGLQDLSKRRKFARIRPYCLRTDRREGRWPSKEAGGKYVAGGFNKRSV